MINNSNFMKLVEDSYYCWMSLGTGIKNRYTYVATYFPLKKPYGFKISTFYFFTFLAVIHVNHGIMHQFWSKKNLDSFQCWHQTLLTTFWWIFWWFFKTESFHHSLGRTLPSLPWEFLSDTSLAMLSAFILTRWRSHLKCWMSILIQSI